MDYLFSAILTIILIASSITLSFLYAYVKKKGDNIATKDDIQKLTEITEKVKNELNLLHDSKLSFQTLRRQAIIEYHSIFLKWMNYVSSLTISPVTGQVQRDTFKETDAKLERMMRKINDAESN